MLLLLLWYCRVFVGCSSVCVLVCVGLCVWLWWCMGLLCVVFLVFVAHRRGSYFNTICSIPEILHPGAGFPGYSKSSCTKEKVCISQESFIPYTFRACCGCTKKKYVYPRNLEPSQRIKKVFLWKQTPGHTHHQTPRGHRPSALLEGLLEIP